MLVVMLLMCNHELALTETVDGIMLTYVVSGDELLVGDESATVISLTIGTLTTLSALGSEIINRCL